MNRVCTILARRGSVGLPGKNVRLLEGVPLVSWSIRHAHATGLFNVVVVSTDDPLVREIALIENVDLVVARPRKLATSTASKIPGIRHAVAKAEAEFGQRFDVVVDLQPTSPLRSLEDIHGAVELLESELPDVNVVTGCQSHKSPYFDIVERDDQGFIALVAGTEKPIARRQDASITYDLNGAVYVWWREHLNKVESAISARTLLFAMPGERSVDIDSELDFHFAEFLRARSGSASRDLSRGTAE
jgi:CMP-N,N'-diacetyllegionaminic acid synthase